MSILLLPGHENQFIDLKYLDAVLFHSPFCKLVQKSLARLMLNDFVRMPEKERSLKYPGLENFRYVVLWKEFNFNPEVVAQEKKYSTYFYCYCIFLVVHNIELIGIFLMSILYHGHRHNCISSCVLCRAVYNVSIKCQNTFCFALYEYHWNLRNYGNC